MEKPLTFLRAGEGGGSGITFALRERQSERFLHYAPPTGPPPLRSNGPVLDALARGRFALVAGARGSYVACRISVTEARSIISQAVAPLAPSRIPLAEARGRILRETVSAPGDLPAFDRSAMDGYAVAIADESERFRVVMEVQAGPSPESALTAGECARVFTGAKIPSGASQVIMQEAVRQEGEWMIPLRRDHTTHIRHRGEDAMAGAVLLESGARLRASELALLAQLGAMQPLVSPAPRVLHITTGRELVPPEMEPRDGEIRDTNSSMVAAMLADRGSRLQHQSRCADDLAETVARISSVEEASWDVLLISGGASVGDYDFGAKTLRNIGFTIHFDRLNLRPGKPLIFGTRRAQAAFVLPGNPVSHLVTFHLAVRLALECLEAAPSSWPLAAAMLLEDLPAQSDLRETYWPCEVRSEGGTLRARLLGWKSSGDLCGLAGVNALLQLLPASAPLSRGDSAKCLLLDLA